MRGAIVLGGAALVGIPLFLMGWVRTPYSTGEANVVRQPMWFDHRHHVTGFRIDCRYCHSAVERSATAGMPATAVCVPCHNQAWLRGPFFEPVRRSMSTGRPIPWQRVHDLPDFAFFHHGIHVRKGVGCETCHGRVDQMPLVRQVVSLSMSWCLDCHREPERYLRPVEQVTTMGWDPGGAQLHLGRELTRRYNVRELTDCVVCHR